MTKELSKAITFRARFRHQVLMMKTSDAKAKYKKQRNIWVISTKKAEKNYRESLDLNNMPDNKMFSGTVNPLFSSKIKLTKNIVLRTQH